MDKAPPNIIDNVEIFLSQSFDFLLTYFPNILLVITILFVGFRLADFLSKMLINVSRKSKYIDETLSSFLSYVIRYVIIFLTILISLERFGINIASMIALLGAAGLAVGLALQNLLSNIAASLLISIIRPFKINDYVVAGGAEGVVVELNLFMVKIRSANGTEIMVPNNHILSEKITVYYPDHPLRYDFNVKIDCDQDIDNITHILIECFKADKRTLAKPTPEVRILGLSDGLINIKACCWVASHMHWTYSLEMNRMCIKTLANNKIKISQPYLTLSGNK